MNVCRGAQGRLGGLGCQMVRNLWATCDFSDVERRLMQGRGLTRSPNMPMRIGLTLPTSGSVLKLSSGDLSHGRLDML